MTRDNLTVEAVHPCLPALLEWLTQQEDEGRRCLDGNVARSFKGGYEAGVQACLAKLAEISALMGPPTPTKDELRGTGYGRE